MNLEKLLNPKSVAVIGASPTPNKVGNIILKNMIKKRLDKLYPVNPKHKTIEGLKCYRSIKEIKNSIDCVVIATPPKTVVKLLEECAEKNVKAVIIITSGFEEINNLEDSNKIKEIAEKNKIAILGPNCLGALNTHGKLDAVFLPPYKMSRPQQGGVSFISQSGAVGSAVMDLISYYGLGVSKFISYGNATVLDESDFLEYLRKDKETETIILYLEGVKDGKKFLRTLKKTTKEKPVLVLKGGKYRGGQRAAKSHTGNIAGSYLAYKAAFRQAKAIEVDDIYELFDIVKTFTQPLPKGNRVAIITNGGGLGILTADEVEKQGLELAQFNKETEKKLEKILPDYGNVGNPLDLVADANVEGYRKALEILLKAKEVDSIIVITLMQTPLMDDRIINILTKYNGLKKKPIINIAIGGEYTEAFRKIFERNGITTYASPHSAVKALKKLTNYARERPHTSTINR